MGMLEYAESWSEALSLSKFFCVGPIPADTNWRNRPALDPVEGLLYWYHRQVRHLKQFYYTSLVGLQNLVWDSVFYTAILRFGCIWLGLGKPLRLLCRMVGLGDRIAMHQGWFVGA